MTRHEMASVPAAPRRRASGRRLVVVASAIGLLFGALAGVDPATAQDPGPRASVPPGTASPPGSVPPITTAAESTPRDRAVHECLAGDRPTVVAGPLPATPYLNRIDPVPAGTVVDARGGRLDNSDLNRAGFGIAVRIRRELVGEGTCFVGGSLRTDLDPEATSWDTWHRVTAMDIAAPGFRVVGTAFRNQGDLIAFKGAADGWQVIGVRADGGSEHPGAYAHDDCVENDSMLSGVIEDSKFDGCASFLSSTQASEHRLDGSDNAVAVRGTLVRLQPYRNSFNVPKYGEGAHGGFFKWARTTSTVMIPPALSVTDSVFRADGRPRYGGNENGLLGLPPGTRCERVLLIGTEAWSAKDVASWQDQCVDLRLGTIADWDAAVAAWDAAHPPLRDLAGSGRDVLGAALGW